MKEGVERIRDAIQERYACVATHVESVRVVEMAGFKKVWQGIVEVFEISGHPTASRCYGWRSFSESKPKYITILEIGLVDSAQMAVRSAIASGYED